MPNLGETLVQLDIGNYTSFAPAKTERKYNVINAKKPHRNAAFVKNLSIL